MLRTVVSCFAFHFALSAIAILSASVRGASQRTVALVAILVARALGIAACLTMAKPTRLFTMISSFWTFKLARSLITDLLTVRRRSAAHVTGPYVTVLSTVRGFTKDWSRAFCKRLAGLMTRLLGYTSHVTSAAPAFLVTWLEPWFSFWARHITVFVASLFTSVVSSWRKFAMVDFSLCFYWFHYSCKKQW